MMLITLFDKNFNELENFLVFNYENIFSFSKLKNYIVNNFSNVDENQTIECMILYFIMNNVNNWKNIYDKYKSFPILDEIINFFVFKINPSKNIILIINDLIETFKYIQNGTYISFFYNFINNIFIECLKQFDAK